MLNKHFASTLLVGQMFFMPFAFVLTSKPVFGYCVYNHTSKKLFGRDMNGPVISNRWNRTLDPNTHDCCPGHQSECKGARIRIFLGNRHCEYNVSPHGWLKVTEKNDGSFVCANYREKNEFHFDFMK